MAFDVYYTEVDWNKLSPKDKLYSDLIMCCDCGTYHKKDKMFIKQYSNTAICLCKKCAKKLCNDIVQFDCGYNDSMNKSELMDWYINSVSPDDKPVWTEEHIDELLNDFYVIPKDQ